MATFPTTTEELDEYISGYMDAHIAERMGAITDQEIGERVRAYMRDYADAMENNGAEGEVPLIPDNELQPTAVTMPLARVDGAGQPVAYIQVRVSALAALAASHFLPKSVWLTQEAYDELVEAEEIDENTEYNIYEPEE